VHKVMVVFLDDRVVAVGNTRALCGNLKPGQVVTFGSVKCVYVCTVRDGRNSATTAVSVDYFKAAERRLIQNGWRPLERSQSVMILASLSTVVAS